MAELISGAIASKISSLTNRVIQDLTNPDTKISISDLLKVVEIDPTAMSCIEIKSLRASRILGEFQHEEKKIQSWMQSQFDNMKGTLTRLVRHMAGSSMGLGRSTAEVVVNSRKLGKFGEWRLTEINPLEPGRVTPRGHFGNITQIKYQDGEKEVYMPSDKCLHVANGSLNFDRKTFYGSGEIKRAYPYMKLKQLIYAEMGVSAKRLATGILIARGDSNNRVQIYDSQGKPVTNNGQPLTKSVTEMLNEQLKSLENNSFITTDKANEITALQVGAGEQFWNLAINLCDAAIMKSFLVPRLLLEEGSGSLGVNGLGNTHLSIMDATIEAVVSDIKDELVEKVTRPLIRSKFGKQKNYGSWELKSKADPQTESLLMNMLTTVMSIGIIPSTDLDAVNKIREYIGINPLTKEENAFQSQVQQQLQQLQQLQQQNPQQGSGDPQQQQSEEDISSPYP